MKKINVIKPATSMFLSLTLFLLILGCQGTAQDKSDKKQESNLPSSSIQEAAYFGNTKVVQEYVDAQLNLNQKDAYGSTPLHIAAVFNRIDVAKVLIQGGADINATNADGSTPLHSAAFFGRIEIVKALLDKGAAVDVENDYKSTALASVQMPFEEVKPFYDQISKDLGPLGLKLDYTELQKNREIIAKMIAAKQK